MSVIVQNISSETDRSFYLFTKGADSEILRNITLSQMDNMDEITGTKTK